VRHFTDPQAPVLRTPAGGVSDSGGGYSTVGYPCAAHGAASYSTIRRVGPRIPARHYRETTGVLPAND
jgi:hypothetical protein